jgi:hypothetical protein
MFPFRVIYNFLEIRGGLCQTEGEESTTWQKLEAVSTQHAEKTEYLFFSLLFYNRLMRSPTRLCFPLVNLWMPKTWYIYIYIYISWHLSPSQCFINPSHQSVCLCVFLLLLQGNGSVKCIPPFGARQRLGKHIPAEMNKRNTRGIVGRVIFYAVRFLSKESLWVCLCIPHRC